MPGIYVIINSINTKIYIGSSINVEKRIKRHIYELMNNKHPNKYLQRSVNKYGINSFIFKILEKCQKEDLLTIEQTFLDLLQPEYNIFKIAGSPLGFKHSESTKRKMSKIVKEKCKDPERKRKLDMAREKARNWTEERKRKHSEKLKGRTLTEKHKKNIGISNLGHSVSDETKKKLSIAHKGKKLTEAHKKAMSKSRRGVPRKGITILQYSLDNKLIAEYSKIKTVTKKIKISHTSISNCLTNRSKTAGGYIWKYKKQGENFGN